MLSRATARCLTTNAGLLPNSEQRSEIDETTPLLRCRDTTKKGVHGLVYDALDRVEVRQDERGYLLTYKGTEPKLPQVVKARIDEVLKKYANKKAWELEKKNVKKKLGVDMPEKLGAYMGWTVEEYAEEEGIELKQREICG